jgi:multidrug efflux pump subunit AcrA (membrane-fusion protein)
VVADSVVADSVVAEQAEPGPVGRRVTDVADGNRRRTRRRRPVVIGATLVLVLLVAGGATALAASGSGDGGYRMGSVVRASMDTDLVVVGTIEPVNDASVSFQVAGQVASVSIAAGAEVTAGEGLAALDTTALSESVSSAELSLQSADAKLTEDEDSETANTNGSTTTTTVPKTSTSTSSSISQDQAALVADQATSSADQQQEAADLKQAETACGLSSITTPTSTSPSTSTTTTPTSSPTSTGTSGCTSALQQVSTDQQAVAKDEQAVAADEATLAKALTSEESSSGSASSTASKSSTNASAVTGTSGSGTSKSNAASEAASDSAAQIATDEAAIDTAQANLVGAQQSLTEGQLTSPINGTIVSVGISVGDTVGADSSTEDIVIIGTKSFEATATLTSAQVPSVKVGSTASVAVDGTTGSINGTVSQVGPVQSTDSGYSYPVVVALPASANDLFSGSTADIAIVTGAKKDVLAVPTSAVTTTGTRSTVVVLSGGNPVDQSIKIGLVGAIYTQVLSGVKQGQEVVLANYADPVPASNTATVGGFGGGGTFGGGAGGFGGGTARFNVTGSGFAG